LKETRWKAVVCGCGRRGGVGMALSKEVGGVEGCRLDRRSLIWGNSKVYYICADNSSPEMTKAREGSIGTNAQTDEEFGKVLAIPREKSGVNRRKGSRSNRCEWLSNLIYSNHSNNVPPQLRRKKKVEVFPPRVG
jgi:hypothetical protein